jgi:hypothetical protein
MTYTDGRRSPRPTQSERAFSELTDIEREAMAELWLKARVGKRVASRLYPKTSGPVKPEVFP